MVRCLFFTLLVSGALAGCMVKIKGPDKPIVVDLNIKVEHEVKVKVSKELDSIIHENPDLFQIG